MEGNVQEQFAELFSVGIQCVHSKPKVRFGVDFCSGLVRWSLKPAPMRLQMLDFLNGAPVVCHGNYIFAVVRGSDCFDNRMDLEDPNAIVERWFTRNPNFGVACMPTSLAIESSVIPGSVHLVKSCINLDRKGETFQKLIVKFSTEFRCAAPIPDIPASDLAVPYTIGLHLGERATAKRYLRALKAVVQNPQGLYIHESEDFIALPPQSPQEAERIFVCKMRHCNLLDNDMLALYGRVFDFTEAELAALRKTGSKDSIAAHMDFLKLIMDRVKRDPHVYADCMFPDVQELARYYIG